MSNQKLKVKAREPEIRVNGVTITDTLIRRTQPVCGSQSTIFILPKKQLEKIGLNKGDYVKISICNGDSLLIQKVD
jgi:hypothetical protein